MAIAQCSREEKVENSMGEAVGSSCSWEGFESDPESGSGSRPVTSDSSRPHGNRKYISLRVIGSCTSFAEITLKNRFPQKSSRR